MNNNNAKITGINSPSDDKFFIDIEWADSPEELEAYDFDIYALGNVLDYEKTSPNSARIEFDSVAGFEVGDEVKKVSIVLF